MGESAYWDYVGEMGDWRVLTGREKILGVSYFDQSKPIKKHNYNYLNGLSLVLKHNGVMSMDPCFHFSPVLYLLLF